MYPNPATALPLPPRPNLEQYRASPFRCDCPGAACDARRLYRPALWHEATKPPRWSEGMTTPSARLSSREAYRKVKKIACDRHDGSGGGIGQPSDAEIALSSSASAAVTVRSAVMEATAACRTWRLAWGAASSSAGR